MAEDKIEIVERLGAIDEEAMYHAPATTKATVDEAALTIQSLVKALEPFAKHADVKEKVSGSIQDDMAVHVVMSELRRARSVLSKLRGKYGCDEPRGLSAAEKPCFEGVDKNPETLQHGRRG